MITIRLSPSLASHAPNDRRITLIIAMGILDRDKESGTKRTIVSITPSKDNSVISRCEWWRIRASMAINGRIWIISVKFVVIEPRLVICRRLTRSLLQLLAFDSDQVTQVAI